LEPVVVIDFETTGISPDQGERATEVAAVRVRDGRIIERYQSLMNTGRRIPPFIEHFTGITNTMVRAAPPAARVMAEVADFVGDTPVVAHNAAFDRKFWVAELTRIGRTAGHPFVCSLLLSRRLLPESPNHQLSTLVRHAGLPVAERAHRALADAEMTAHLFVHLERTLRERFALAEVTHALLERIQRTARGRLEWCVERYGRIGG
jgi:DNA polymerase-3 subunit epsilon